MSSIRQRQTKTDRFSPELEKKVEGPHWTLNQLKKKRDDDLALSYPKGRRTRQKSSKAFVSADGAGKRRLQGEGKKKPKSAKKKEKNYSFGGARGGHF